jgi:predicted nucleotidyltransferase
MSARAGDLGEAQDGTASTGESGLQVREPRPDTTMCITSGWQEATLGDLTRLLQPNEAVRALVLFGTAAQPGQDLWSDVDLLLVVDEAAKARFHPATDWLAPLGELYTWEQSADRFRSVTRACFSDFRRIDVVITTEAALEQVGDWPGVPFWKGTRTLFSRSPRVDRVLAESFVCPPPQLPTPDEFQAMVNGFWFKGVLAVTRVVRDDLLIAVHLALEMVQDCCVLGMLLRDRSEGTAHHWHGGAGNPVVARLAPTCQPYTAAGILDSLEQSSIAFDRLAREWSDAYQARHHRLLSWINLARRERNDHGLSSSR